MLVTLCGMAIVLSSLQPENRLLGSSVSPCGRTISERPSHEEKAPGPMLVTLSGTETLFKYLFSAKA